MDKRTVPAITIVLEVFSGRPNPVWRLTGEVAQEAVRRIRAVPEGAACMDRPPSLGYRGLIVTFEGLVSHNNERRIYTVPIDAAVKSSRNDPVSALELWLLETGRDVVGSVLLDHIRQERGYSW